MKFCITLLVFIFASFVQAEPFVKNSSSSWVNADFTSTYLELNDLKFTNRARCAADSNAPTKSIFLIIDTLNVAKVSYRLAQATQSDKKEMTKSAVERFRYGVINLLNYIAKEISRGSLPLLPSNLANADKDYQSILSSCQGQEYCQDLDLYIEQKWNQRKADSKNASFKVACYLLKKNSPLQSHLQTTKPDGTTLAKLGLAVGNQNEFLASCFDLDAHQNLDYVAYQIDVRNDGVQDWKNSGFDFWNSVKLYFSWAWRNSTELESFVYPYADLFRNIHLEDAVMMFSNGCGSLSPASCDVASLSEEKIRDFALFDYKEKESIYDHSLFFPEGAEDDLLKDRTPDINSDIISLGKFPDMTKWLENFRNNFVNKRGKMKGRLLRAVNTLNLITKHQTTLNIEKNLAAVVYENRANEYYQLCAEYMVASDETLSFMRKDLSLLKNLKTLDPIFNNLTDQTLSDFYRFYEDLIPRVTKLCKALERMDYWKDNQIDKSGFHTWYKEVVYKNTAIPDSEGKERGMLSRDRGPFLALTKYEQSQNSDDVICNTGIDCARQVLNAIVNIYSVATYSSLYFGQEQSISTPNMNNPYAERVACKIYDPWAKQRQNFMRLISDIITSSVSYIVPTPFYISIGKSEKKVISFNKLVENGEIKLEPKYNKQKLLAAVGVDFGTWLGTPCTVTFANNAEPIHLTNKGKYFFSGITFEGCREDSESTMTVMSASDISHSPKKDLMGCISCSMNFVSAASLKILYPEMTKGFAALSLLRGIIRFFKAQRDPIDIPRNWTVNINNTFETLRRYGDIPKKCVPLLSTGKNCLDTPCDQNITDALQKHYGLSVRNISWKNQDAVVRANFCKDLVMIKNARNLMSNKCSIIEKSQIQGIKSCSLNRIRRIKHEID